MNLPYKVGISKKLKGIRGMIADRDIKKGELIERCPLILIPMEEYESHLKKTILKRYYYDYNDKFQAVLCGYGFLINHSSHPNAKYTWGYKYKVIIFRAIKNIKKGDEITINYNNGSKKKLDKYFTDYKF